MQFFNLTLFRASFSLSPKLQQAKARRKIRAPLANYSGFAHHIGLLNCRNRAPSSLELMTRVLGNADWVR